MKLIYKLLSSIGTILISASLSNCSHVPAKFIPQDSDQLYLHAHAIAPLRVPSHIKNQHFHTLYPVISINPDADFQLQPISQTPPLLDD